MNPIFNQSKCDKGSWVFAACTSMEGAHFQASGKLLKFAEQQLIDCVHDAVGCYGGNPALAYDYYLSHDAMKEHDYPYYAKNNTSCAYQSGTHVRAENTDVIPIRDVVAMKDALSKNVLSVAIEISCDQFYNYKSGIFTDDYNECGGLNLNHFNNIVGWGVDEDSKLEYWIMRNSWGTEWGEQGYMRLKIQEGMGVVGIQKQALFTTSN